MAPGLATQLHASPMSPRQALPPASSMETLITSPLTGGTLPSWASAPTSWPNPVATRQVGPWRCRPSPSPRPGRGARGRESWAGGAGPELTAGQEGSGPTVEWGVRCPPARRTRPPGEGRLRPLSAQLLPWPAGTEGAPSSRHPRWPGWAGFPGRVVPGCSGGRPHSRWGPASPLAFSLQSRVGAPPPPLTLRNVSGMSEPPGVLPRPPPLPAQSPSSG